MNPGKKFVVDVSEGGRYGGTLQFESRTELASWLRGRGCSFRDSVLCGLGWDSVDLDGTDASYHVEEMGLPPDRLSFMGRTYIPVARAAKLSGAYLGTLRKWVREGRLDGMTVGRHNSSYIWEGYLGVLGPGVRAEEVRRWEGL